MECPKCHTENKENSRFCSNCAVPLGSGGPEPVSLTMSLEIPLHILKPGSLIAGKYRILEEIGQGGMGIVYKTEDLKLKRCVALKFLPPHLMDSRELKERFLIEAQAAAALSHPNICVIHEVGETEDLPYIAMEYVEGETLRDKIKKGPLKPEEALDIITQVAAGLGEAHGKGIIHRDIKSANIMVTKKGQAKVMDFGLAKLRGGSSLTKSQTTLGTVAYMSPEQARGDELDGRTDIWSLGIVLYEMLAGKLPFRGDHDQTVIYSIFHHEPESLVKARPGTAPELEHVVGQALAKNPADRYQTMEEFWEDLAAVTEGFRPLRAKRRAARRRILGLDIVYLFPAALAVILVLFSLNVGGVRDRLLGRSASPAHAIKMAVLPFANLTGDPEQEYLNDGVTQEMITQLGRLHPQSLSVIARTSVMRYKKGDTPVDQIGRELGVEYVLEGSARREANRVRITAELIQVRDQTQLWADSYEQELSGFGAVQSEVAQSVAKALALKLLPAEQTRLASARTVNSEVYAAYLKGMFYVSQNNPESFEKGMRYLHQAVEIDPAEPLAYAGLAQGYITLGHGGAEQLDAFPRAKAAAEQALKLDPEMAEAVGVLADVALYYEWDWAKAEKLFKRALELNPSLAMTHYHYAWYLVIFDRLDEAIAEHKLARDLDPLRALNTGWLGALYNFSGRYDEAIVEAKKAIDLNPDFWPSYQVLRIAYSKKGMHQEAVATAERLVELNPMRGYAHLTMAYALAGQREKALAISSKFERNTRSFNHIGQAYLMLGDKEAALQELEDAYKAHQTTVPWIRARGYGWDSMHDEPRFQDLLRRMNLLVDEKK
ncbi:MAG: protein kinase [Clostridiales bacterium]|nr:protein kinase [Clostridiales bacterium]